MGPAFDDKEAAPADDPRDPHNIVSVNADAILKVRDAIRASEALSRIRSEPEDWREYHSEEEALAQLDSIAEALREAVTAVDIVIDLVKDEKSGV